MASQCSDIGPPLSNSSTLRSTVGPLVHKPLPRPPSPQRCLHFLSHSLPNYLSKLVPSWMRLGGWRATVFAGAVVSVLSLSINIAILSYGITKPTNSFTRSPILAEGSCSQLQSIFTWSHLGINVLSSLLLGASNAAMQCLIAPTRPNINIAHSRGRCLDIGSGGTKNWVAIERWRKLLWIALVVTTVPLHILYNSVIFSITTANAYTTFLVTQGFPEGVGFNISTPDSVILATASELQANASLGYLQRLENSDCMSAYNTTFVSQYSNVALVTNLTLEHSSQSPEEGVAGSVIDYYPYDKMASNSYQMSNGFPAHMEWMCNYDFSWTTRPCDPDPGAWLFPYFSNSTNAKGGIASVEYCLAQQIEPSCMIGMSCEIMVVVIIFNALKLVCFLLAIYKMSFQPLVTLGDAMASFLASPDPSTKGYGALDADHVHNVLQSAHTDTTRLHPLQEYRFQQKNVRRQWPRRRWFHGASPIRWGSTIIMILHMILIIVVSMALAKPLQDTWLKFVSEDMNGLGQVDTNRLIGSGRNNPIIGDALIANMPQLLLSIFYIYFNVLLANLLVSREFSAFSCKRSGLRVTNPKGKYQRSTYWLSLPYRFSIPLLAASILLHWSLSQTLFLAEVQVLGPEGTVYTYDSVNCIGWSNLGLITLMAILGIMLIALLSVGCFRYPAGAPIVWSCSLAISAACHPLPGKNNEAEQLLKYGVIGTDQDGNERVGLSSGPVRPLVDGHDYV